MVIPYRHFGKTYQSLLQESKNPKQRTEHNGSYLTQYSFEGPCPSSDILNNHEVLEASSVSVFRQRSTNWLTPQIKLFSINGHHGKSNLLRYVPENRSGLRVVKRKWLLKD